ncbi:HPr family phosphocarrier protein [Collinsella provencensis]|uniref:HPr family phosphocarrier protein n=1 Tax=Collinsella provencensis TaxID=1937461 RepID=UPI000C85BBAD|nr:HPr family phosphocarrier protein [Collinsella provencensis]
MQVFEYTITDPVGLHARPAANLSRMAASLESDVRVKKSGGEKDADAKSMLAVMSLGVRSGDIAVFTVSGEREGQDATALREFCNAEL